MARYTVGYQTITMVPVADGSAFTSAGIAMVLQGGSATMLAKINEVYIGGESTSSTPTTMVYARDSTIGVTFSGGTNALMDVQSTAPGTIMVFGNTITTKPQRAATLHLLQLSLNTFGGIARWQARYGEEITQYGASVNVGETSLSSVTGAGIASGHIIYELV